MYMYIYIYIYMDMYICVYIYIYIYWLQTMSAYSARDLLDLADDQFMWLCFSS